jgi:hypothetical protein
MQRGGPTTAVLGVVEVVAGVEALVADGAVLLAVVEAEAAVLELPLPPEELPHALSASTSRAATGVANRLMGRCSGI